jgi:hypothetical protein
LQWLDSATLDVLEDLLTEPDIQHLILVGAYRDNEVSSAHSLMRRLEAIRKAGARVQEIILAPLALADLGQLIADALHSEPDRVIPLAQLVEKTAGNPFFAIQFITALAEEALLTFDHGNGRWSWDLNRIQAKSYTDNVVELMVGKLNRLPCETQKALREFACLGIVAEVKMLSTVLGTSEAALHLDLWEALRQELVVRLKGSYKFVHDRIQEAAYSLIPQESRPEVHLRIGRSVGAHTPREKQEEAIFDIVNQFNRATALITSQEEREQVTELNLIAGRRAKASGACAAALRYFETGTALLANDCWERQRELTFALELHRAECEFLTGELTAAEERLTALSTRAANTVERAAVACLRVDIYATLDQFRTRDNSRSRLFPASGRGAARSREGPRFCAEGPVRFRYRPNHHAAGPRADSQRTDSEIWFLDDAQFNELWFERHLASNPGLARAECWYWIRKLQVRFLAGDCASAVDASLNAQRQLWTSPSQFETAEFRFYGALSHAASWDSASPEQRQQHFEALAAHHRLLEVWAENCPENFENRAALVGAEIARIEHRELDAERLYEQAIRSSHANGFVHNEALANELAARFYGARGFDTIAHAYLRKARYCYLCWGASGKVRQLDELYPQLREDEWIPGPTSTIGTPIEHLDLATVIKVSQAVSGEVVLEKLIDRLMRAAIEHAGASRGLFLVPEVEGSRIEAEATTGHDAIQVCLR